MAASRPSAVLGQAHGVRDLPVSWLPFSLGDPCSTARRSANCLPLVSAGERASMSSKAWWPHGLGPGSLTAWCPWWRWSVNPAEAKLPPGVFHSQVVLATTQVRTRLRQNSRLVFPLANADPAEAKLPPGVPTCDCGWLRSGSEPG